MKVRNGFVSNSSSSSFIIASKKLPTNTKITININLQRYTEHKFKSIEELIKYYIEDYGMSMEEILIDDTFLKCRKAIIEGKTIFFGSFSNQSGDPVEEALCELGLNEIESSDNSFEIIQSKGGF